MNFLKNNILPIVISIIFIVGGGFFFWFLFTPEYTIYPEVSEIHFDSDGGTYVLPITTDADYSSWHVRGSYFLHVSKNASSITITCSPNDEEYEGCRTGYIYLSCDGKNKDEVEVEVIQEESNMYVFGDIKDVKIIHNEEAWTEYDEYQRGMKIKIQANVRHSHSKVKICAWFYHSDRSVIKNNNRYYSTTSGRQVTVQRKLRIYGDGMDYTTVDLFIPYSEFPNETGMICKVGIIEYDTDEDGNEIASYWSKRFNVSGDYGSNS